MFKWLIPLLLLPSLALAQNTTCSDRPFGESSNACADTRFVQQAIAPIVGSAITALTGDVIATGPGSVAATIQPGVVTAAKMAAGAAASNVGTLGGVLTGTLPNPGMASGAAATNVGTLGGVLSGTLPNPGYAATAGANTYLSNQTNSPGTPSFNARSNCNGANSALNYTNGTGETCNANVANLTTTGQTLSGGATVTTVSLATGNITVNCGSGPLQSITNGGAFTITNPANDSACDILITNNASAGAITFTGFTQSAAATTALTTTNTSKFMLHVERINGISTSWATALQ